MTAPDGFDTVTPYIVVKDGKGALALYEKAVGAEICGKLEMPGSDKIAHACFQIGSSKIFLSDENDQMPAPTDGIGARFYIYVDDVDAQHKQALAAGMTEKAAPEDMFWGDRTAVLTCPYGHTWTIATHVRDVSPEDLAEAMKAMAG
ncbi:MAG: VOC family protein [Methyloligellaceae bacterium]